MTGLNSMSPVMVVVVRLQIRDGNLIVGKKINWLKSSKKNGIFGSSNFKHHFVSLWKHETRADTAVCKGGRLITCFFL